MRRLKRFILLTCSVLYLMECGSFLGGRVLVSFTANKSNYDRSQNYLSLHGRGEDKGIHSNRMNENRTSWTWTLASENNPISAATLVKHATLKRRSKQIVEQQLLFREREFIGERAKHFKARATPVHLEMAAHKKYPDNFTAVVIATYMRSGSSLTGDMLQQHPDAFYIYEPLRSLQKMKEARKRLTYLGGRVVGFPFDFLDIGTKLIEGWLTCNFELIFLEAFRDSFLEFGKKSMSMSSCLESHLFLKCLERLRNSCLSSRLRIVKTIRLPMVYMSNFFQIIPDFRIIHLIRDPRATLFSQSQRGKCSLVYGGTRGCANALCARVEYDTAFEESLDEIFLQKMITIKYEDIAAKPVEFAKVMYKFTGMNFTGTIRKYIVRITSSGKEDNCVICTTRENSKRHINAWKRKLDPKSRRIIESRCHKVMKAYTFSSLAIKFTGTPSFVVLSFFIAITLSKRSAFDFP